MQSDAITPLQPVPQSIAAILHEHKERSTYSLGKYTAEAAEAAAEHPDKLSIARKVRDVASVHSTLWPEETREGLIDGGILLGLENVINESDGYVCSGPDKGKYFPVERDQEEEKSEEPPVFARSAEPALEALPAASVTEVAPEVTPVPLDPHGNGTQPVEAVVEDPARSAYRERCMYWRRCTHTRSYLTGSY
jgi:hypothetical protein